jgi:hypothetical protein
MLGSTSHENSGTRGTYLEKYHYSIKNILKMKIPSGYLRFILGVWIQ